MGFNQLSDRETEQLAWLMEEMAEASQIIGKILRHGYDSTHRDYGNVANRYLLEKELGHVAAALDLIKDPEFGSLSSGRIILARDEKVKKVLKYLHHQGGWAKYIRELHGLPAKD